MEIGKSIIRGAMVRAEGRLWEETCSGCSVERSKDAVVSKGCVKAAIGESKGIALSCRVEKSTGVRVAEESVVVVAVVELELQVDVEASRASKSISKEAWLTTLSPLGRSYCVKSWLRNSEKSSWREDQSVA